MGQRFPFLCRDVGGKFFILYPHGAHIHKIVYGGYKWVLNILSQAPRLCNWVLNTLVGVPNI